MARRSKGCQTVTVPQSVVRPSAVNSYSRPPTRGSRITSIASASKTECVAIGHQLPIRSVKRRKASSRGSFTVTEQRTSRANSRAFINIRTLCTVGRGPLFCLHVGDCPEAGQGLRPETFPVLTHIADAVRLHPIY